LKTGLCTPIFRGNLGTSNGLLLMAGLLVLAVGVSLLLRWGRGAEHRRSPIRPCCLSGLGR